MIWVRLTFAIFKCGECHVWQSVFVCKYYIWRVLFWRIQRASQNSRNKVLAEIKHPAVYALCVAAEMEIVRAMKHEVCYVAEDYAEELKVAESTTELETTYELPDGRVITLGEERFKATEPLFEPSLIGKIASLPVISSFCGEKFNVITALVMWCNRRNLQYHALSSCMHAPIAEKPCFEK